MSSGNNRKYLRIAVLCCLVIPMAASYFFDDMFSSVSHLFQHPDMLELGWDSKNLGDFIGDYSLLCVFGGLIVGGILLDIFGIRLMGSIFIGMMTAGAVLAFWGVSGSLPKAEAIALGRAGRMLFGLGSEIAGVAVTRSIAKWFKNGNMSLAMGLQLAVARGGTAIALIAAPFIVGVPKDYYSVADTARPALVGLFLLMAGFVCWLIFINIDRREDRRSGIISQRGEILAEEKFSFKDLLSLIKNPSLIMIGLLCVSFYCCVSSFKKFGTAVVIPRFGIEQSVAGFMVAMIPFFTIIFTPIFGALVDRTGHACRWMAVGAAGVLCGHLTLAFAPQGVAFFGYAGIAFLGFGYSLLPSAMWPSVPKVVPEKDLGTAYSLIYWIQNVGLLLIPKIVGRIFNSNPGLEGVAKVEWLFIGLGIFAVCVAVILRKYSAKNHPELV